MFGRLLVLYAELYHGGTVSTALVRDHFDHRTDEIATDTDTDTDA